MEATQEQRSIVRDLAAQLRVPSGWEVLVGRRLTGAWLGTLAVDVAVLAPGPEGASLARAQLVVICAGAAGGVVERLGLAAAADVPESWLVDMDRGWTEVYRAPFDGRYRSRTIVYPGEAVVPLALTRTTIEPLRPRSAR